MLRAFYLDWCIYGILSVSCLYTLHIISTRIITEVYIDLSKLELNPPSRKLSTLLAQYMMKKDELASAFYLIYISPGLYLVCIVLWLLYLIICICPFLKEKEHFQASSRRIHSSGEDRECLCQVQVHCTLLCIW